MFGFENKNMTITGASARIAREKLSRMRSNNLNESDLEEIARMKAVQTKYNVTWK